MLSILQFWAAIANATPEPKSLIGPEGRVLMGAPESVRVCPQGNRSHHRAVHVLAWRLSCYCLVSLRGGSLDRVQRWSNLQTLAVGHLQNFCRLLGRRRTEVSIILECLRDRARTDPWFSDGMASVLFRAQERQVYLGPACLVETSDHHRGDRDPVSPEHSTGP
jgi:hypothetical protein